MTIAKWIFAVVLGAFLIVFGVTKFTGGAHIFPYVEYKAAGIGFPFADLFFPFVNYAVGLLEILAGVLVILPATRLIGSMAAALPLVGAVVFHLSPLLGVSTPDGYAEPAPAKALSAGGPFLREHFSSGESTTLFTIAVVMLIVSLLNLFIQRR